MSSPTPILDRAGDLLARYDVVFCDVWGVVHNGAVAYAEGCALLAAFRRAGGTVVLITNAPRHARAVARVLDEKGVPRDCWDTIVSSGALAAAAINERGYARVHHIGPDRDLDLFEDINAERLTDFAAADAIIATGLVHDRCESGEDYRERLVPAAERGLPFICANPDLVVDVGGTLLPCAGAIAVVYEELGGDVLWAGKPHPTPYRRAQAEAERLREASVDPARILAIGDAVRTDIAGAGQFGIDALLIGQGIHRDTLMPKGEINPAALAELLAPAEHHPIAAMPTLR